MADTVSVVYDGHSAAVDIPVLELVNIERGQVVDLPADVADELLERGDWYEAGKSSEVADVPEAQEDGN